MKKNVLLLSIFLFTGAILQAQSINWAYNVNSPPDKRRLTTDPASNLYLYGNSEYYYPNERDGSTINKYSPDGTLLFNRQWKQKFFISGMVNDGAGSFYFCGSFRGSVSGEGITLTSNGASDAFFGKMDENGKIAWTIGFGGAKNDRAYDLCFNADTTEIVITGGIDSTYILYNYSFSNTGKAIFVARFNPTGGLLSFKTLGYYANEYGDNLGREIKNDGADGYYLLASRMGDHWSNEKPTGSPMEGQYILSLDQKLNVRWSTFIISSACYYGYSCANMAVQKGQACVPSFCSGKYGGTGRLQKLDALSGSGNFEITNNDGEYYDTFAHGAQLLYVGNEEANGCPCEDNNPGYARIKRMNERNEDKVLLSKYGFRFYNVTQAPNGNIYVFAETWNDDPVLDGEPLERGYLVFSMQDPPASYQVRKPAIGLLTAFPNPSSGYFEITNENMIEEITVLNGNGLVVRQLKPESKVCTIRDLEQGYYIVRLKDSAGYRSGKLLVTK